MPTCYIVNCKNCTQYNGTKGIKYFTFPKDIAIRQQWLNACGKKETDMKVDASKLMIMLCYVEKCFNYIFCKDMQYPF